jgi:5,10-methylene-tetrahydrofolate dehydrogenase/methenyl tetrahydrofolate cyclohydrolase
MVSERIFSVPSSTPQSANTAAERFNLRDRVVVVTGTSKGIGRELTVLLAETGAVVVPTVRTDTDAAEH